MWSDRVHGALNEGDDFFQLVLAEFAGKARHTAVDQGAAEHNGLQRSGQCFPAAVAEIGDIAAVIDPGNTVAEQAVGDIQAGSVGDMIRIVGNLRYQLSGRVLASGAASPHRR